MITPDISFAELAENFALLDDWDDRYQYLIDLGRKLPPLDAQYKSEEFRLRGCQSVVHFAAEQKDDEIVFHAGSDAAIVQGLIALLIRVYSGRTAEEIRETEAHFLTDIGLDSHLSATRKTGLASMLTAIKAAAQ